jgi:flagella basal body P-ring formation protein FlgA
MSINTTFTAPVQYINQSAILIALASWVCYVTLPEPARRPIVVAANSTIYRWNEIASALGHSGTKVAVPVAANGFFLTDVEKVVDKVLTRNLRESETNS